MKTLKCIGMVILLQSPVLAQSTERLVPDASVSESDAVEIQGVIDQMYVIEWPNMDGPIKPPPPPIDFNAPNYLDLVKYSMVNALVERADRENYWGDVDEKAGYPRRFGPTKARDYYVNLFLKQWELEHVSNSGEALRAVKSVEPNCPDGFEIYEGSGICNQFPSHASAEQNYYHCALNNYQLWLENGDLKRQLETRDIPDFKDGANKGRLWKPEGDPKARCAGGTTILLEVGNLATSIDILDSSFRKIKSPSNFGQLADGRPRFCAEGMPGSSFGNGPIYIQVGDKTYRVNNPANRED